MSRLLLFCLALAFACLTVFVGCNTCHQSASLKARGEKPIYILVHGAWGGGWDWKHMDDLLTADGNKVYRPTLTGQGEHCNLSNTNIDLDTHIQDIVNVILWENLHDVVLAGHSYGGMVITGVADRVPDRIKRLVYIDALVPENGENVNTIISPKLKKPIRDGYVTAPWVKSNPPPPHDVLMPVKTFYQPITLTNQAVAQKLPVTYILSVDKGQKPEQDDFYRFYERAKARGWTVVIMEGDHNVQRSHPKKLAKLIEQTP
jgi:pimeloyl-ACP methyl ester carboxylesterase